MFTQLQDLGHFGHGGCIHHGGRGDVEDVEDEDRPLSVRSFIWEPKQKVPLSVDELKRLDLDLFLGRRNISALQSRW